MGVVYRAEDTRLNRPVALKFLAAESLGEVERQRFLNEARAAAAVQHPNICPIYDVDEADGQIFIAMAFVEGKTLSGLPGSGTGGMDILEAARIGAQIASGLDAAHRQGIVHRDIKGGNIIVDGQGHVSILDFGLALRSGATRLTEAGSAIGTPGYMSPEQAMGKALDHRTDIWSLGVLLFEMVTGVLPFRREHHAAVSYAIVHDPTPPVAGLRPAVPPEMRRLIEKALQKDPVERWQSAQEMATELRRLAGDSGGFAASAGETTKTIAASPALSTPADSAGRPVWKNWYLKVGAAALVLAVLGGGYLLFEKKRAAAPISLPGAATDRQVAVLPFQVANNDPKVAVVADGMAEILTGVLSDDLLFHGKVTAVPASEIRARKINSPAEARRIYGVNLVVSGTARAIAENSLEFTLTLTDAVKARQISSTPVVWDLERPSESKGRIVEALARMLNFELTPLEKKAVTAGDSNTAGAFQAYLEGRGLLARYDIPGNTDKAIEAFQKAIAVDPGYALAYAGLGEGHWRKLLSNRDKASGDLAVANSEKAVQLDGSLAIAHAILGQVYGAVGRQQEAIAHLRKAIEIAPGNAEAPRQLAQILSETGQLKEAEESYVRATKARPTDWYGYLLLGVFYIQQERYAEAEQALRQAQTLTPDNDVLYRNLAAVYIFEARYADAEVELQKALKLRNSAASWAMLAGARFFAHRYHEATASMEAALELDALNPAFWGNLGIYYKWTPGNEGKSKAALGKALEMTVKALETMPDDYRARVNLAEYRARLGDSQGALAELRRVPEAAQKRRAPNVVLILELTGKRADAIRTTADNIAPAALYQIRDDPDLAKLWVDPALQKALAVRKKAPG
ncbi:MAG: serine/threonine-protein kinase [Acidobacteriia bacterium]|nr:serine/threonine-protein kinase [Terriglobia bacterium]